MDEVKLVRMNGGNYSAPLLAADSDTNTAVISKDVLQYLWENLDHVPVGTYADVIRERIAKAANTEQLEVIMSKELAFMTSLNKLASFFKKEEPQEP